MYMITILSATTYYEAMTDTTTTFRSVSVRWGNGNDRDAPHHVTICKFKWYPWKSKKEMYAKTQNVQKKNEN